MAARTNSPVIQAARNGLRDYLTDPAGAAETGSEPFAVADFIMEQFLQRVAPAPAAEPRRDLRKMDPAERARRDARQVYYDEIAAECLLVRNTVRAAGLRCVPNWWLCRACREELGAAPYALDDELLPAAVRVAKRMAFQVGQYLDRLPPAQKSGVYGKEWKARMAGLKDALRCEVRRARPETGIPVSPGAQTLGDYVREKFRQRAEARAGPVPLLAPEMTSPAGTNGRAQVKQASTLECADMANGSTPAAKPQPPPKTGLIKIGGILDGAVDLVVAPDCTADDLEADAEVLDRLAHNLAIAGRSARDGEDAKACVNAVARLMSLSCDYRAAAKEMRRAGHE